MNIAAIAGRLTQDPEVKTTQSGTEVCSFTVAVDRAFTDSQGNRQADFIRCTAWRKSAEFVGKHFRKGDWIGVQGSIQTRSYDAQDGSKRTATEIVADNVRFVGAKAQRGQDQQSPQHNDGFVTVSDDELPF